MRRLLFTLVAILALSLALAACGGGQQETKAPTPAPAKEAPKEAPKEAAKDGKVAVDKSKWPKQASAVCGPEGGSGFALLSVWAPMVNKAAGTNLSVQATGGNNANAIMVHNKQADFGLSTSALVAEGWNGADWTNNLKLTNNRTVAVFMSYVSQYYTLAKSNITKIEDMNGKHVSLGNAGTSSDAWGRRVLAMFNVKPAKISNLAPGQGNGLLKDSLLDVQAVHGSVPHNSIKELEVTENVTVLGLGKEKAEQFIAKYPGPYLHEIKAGTYKNQKEAIYSLGEKVVLTAHKDMPADMVYELVKATYESKADLDKAYKPFAETKIEDAALATIPLHPGAYQYYVEKGVKIPDKVAPPR